jgi:hypothetical protein
MALPEGSGACGVVFRNVLTNYGCRVRMAGKGESGMVRVNNIKWALSPFFILCLILIIALIYATPSIAFENEPDGFKGIKWGIKLSDVLEQLIKYKCYASIKAGFEMSCEKVGENLYLNGVPLSNISYDFKKTKSGTLVLVAGTYHVRQEDASRGEIILIPLKMDLEKKHGKPEKIFDAPPAYLYCWKGDVTFISIHNTDGTQWIYYEWEGFDRAIEDKRK